MIALALTLALAPTPQAIDVEGQVKLANGRPGGLAAVWLEGNAKGKPLAKAMIDQRDRTFIPHVAVVPVGTRVDFPNNDTVMHNVFADYNAKILDLKAYGRGASRNVVFDKEGLVVLQCNMHSEMGAFIMVVDTPYYAVADKNGRFMIKDVPAGKYVVHGWHESKQISKEERVISAGSTLNLSLARRRN